jgi:putative restriction endonuclease
VPDPRDVDLRRAALVHARDLQQRYDDLIPVVALRNGFHVGTRRVSFGSFYSGIFRPKEMQGQAALSIVTAAPKSGRPAPYEDSFDEATAAFIYRFRDPASDTAVARKAADADNRALLAAFEGQEPLLYFKGIFPGQYSLIAPVFIRDADVPARLVRCEVGLPLADTQGEGTISSPDARRYATREAAYRLHQHRFRAAVLNAYGTRCAVCTLREITLLQAAHIVEDGHKRGIASVVNGIALCAIHHLAYERNLLGIDPGGVVHISQRLLEETDGPMLRTGLQGFHKASILTPSRAADRPDPELLEIRWDRFASAA